MPIAEWLHLPNQSAALLFVAICLIAGLVRGFAGFALSAVVMASATALLSPVELLPICWWLEIVASLLLIGGERAHANRKIAYGLTFSSAIGLPIGLALTLQLPAATSKLAALAIIIILTILQLAKLRMPFLATNCGLYGSGLLAGIVSGISATGGMVVVLYVLARQAPTREMRASLILFMFLSSFITLISLLAFGVMDQTATIRGLILAVPAGVGVMLGRLWFTPKWEPYYKPACLALLLALAFTGIVRLAI